MWVHPCLTTSSHSSAASGLTHLLRLQFGQLTLVEWSAALFAALDGVTDRPYSYCPLWLVSAALVGLGFQFPKGDDAVLEWLRQFQAWTARDKDKGNFALPRLLYAGGSAIIVKARSTSVVDGWMPSWRLPAVVATAEQIETAMERCQTAMTAPPLAPRIALCRTRDAGEDTTLDEMIKFIERLAPQATLPEVRTVLLYPKTPSSPPRKTRNSSSSRSAWRISCRFWTRIPRPLRSG